MLGLLSSSFASVAPTVRMQPSTHVPIVTTVSQKTQQAFSKSKDIGSFVLHGSPPGNDENCTGQSACMKFVASLAVYRVLLLRDQGLGQRTTFLEMTRSTMRPLLEEQLTATSERANAANRCD